MAWASRAALQGEADRVANARPGTRNDTLNLAAWRLRQHIENGALTEQEVHGTLAHVACVNGHATDDGTAAVGKTIASGLRAGVRNI